MTSLERYATDPDAGWRAAWIECGDCGHRWVGILEPGCPGDGLECPNCGEMEGWLVKGIAIPNAVELRRLHPDDRDEYLRAVSEHAARHGYPQEWF